MLYFCSRIWLEFYFMTIITVFLKTLPPLTVGKSPLSGKFAVSFFNFFKGKLLFAQCNVLKVNMITSTFKIKIHRFGENKVFAGEVIYSFLFLKKTFSLHFVLLLKV